MYNELHKLTAQMYKEQHTSRQDVLKRGWGTAGKNRYTLYTHSVSEKTGVREGSSGSDCEHTYLGVTDSVRNGMYCLGTEKQDCLKLQ